MFKAVGRGFTLLELTVTVAVLTVAICVSTLSVRGMSDQARLQVAASQVGAVYRTALCEATRSGRPCLLKLDPHGCRIRRPMRRDGEWMWATSPTIDLVSRVSVVSMFPLGPPDGVRPAEPPWEVTVRPGTLNSDLVFVLGLKNGQHRVAKIDGITGVVQLGHVHYESE